MSFLTTAWLVARKDLLVEFRSREIVYTTLLFAASVLLVFSFGFVRDGRAVDDEQSMGIPEAPLDDIARDLDAPCGIEAAGHGMVGVCGAESGGRKQAG